MTRQGRYWILFVIVAVGLALSWGQVGRKAERVLRDEPVVMLVAEQPCRPRTVPCAAVAEDRALVLGPAARGLAVKAAGWRLEDIVRLEVAALADSGDEITLSPPVRDRARDRWSIPMPPPGARVLRIRVRENHTATVADFPL